MKHVETTKKIKSENKAMMNCVHTDSVMKQSPKIDNRAEPCSTIPNNSKLNKFSKDQVLYLRTGFCKHSNLSEFQIPHTDIIIIQCVACNKELVRYYAESVIMSVMAGI